MMTRTILAATACLLAAYASPSFGQATAKDGVFTNAKGMTLYTYHKDSRGKSVCNGTCATNWPPLMAAATDKASGDWGIVTRDDGSKQWAYKGKPLYLWIKDQKPGDRTGDGAGGNWVVAKP